MNKNNFGYMLFSKEHGGLVKRMSQATYEDMLDGQLLAAYRDLIYVPLSAEIVIDELKSTETKEV